MLLFQSANGQLTWSFTACGATGQFGPTQAMVNASYSNTSLNNSVTINVQGIQEWTVPATGVYNIIARGASSGTMLNSSNLTYTFNGAYVSGDFNLTGGTVLSIIVGQSGQRNGNPGKGSGSGGSFVAIGNTPLIVAGGSGGYSNSCVICHGNNQNSGSGGTTGSSPPGTGGGGGSASGGATGGTSITAGANSTYAVGGGGGGGFYTNGGNYSSSIIGGGQAFVNGGNGGAGGGTINLPGGFGGGGGAGDLPGGGGGYSGGGGGNPYLTAIFSGHGGGSFNSGINPVMQVIGGTGSPPYPFHDIAGVVITYTCTTGVVGPTLTCSGNSVTLISTAASNYSWSYSGGSLGTTSAIVVSPTVTTTYSVAGTNSLNCPAETAITVSVAPALTLSVSASSDSACVGSNIILSGIAGGGSQSYSYNWVAGPSGNVSTISPATGGTYVHTLSVTDGIYNCTTTKTISVDFLNNPVLSSPGISICPGSTGTLSVSGAASYSWFPGAQQAATFTANPITTTVYSVSGTSSLGCTGSATTSIFVKPVPGSSFNTFSITCANLGSATVTSSGGIGPYSYTWFPTAQTGIVAQGLNPNTYTVSVYDAGTGCLTDTTTTFTSLIPLTGSLISSGTVSCNAGSNGVASFTNIAGGSGNQNYLWTNGTIILTTNTVNTLSAGQWSVTVTDALTACQVNSVFTITEPPAATLNLSASQNSVCLGSSIVLTGTNSGGTPGYTYTWTNGPPGSSHTVAESSSATYVYTLNSLDANNCLTSNTISVDFVPNPVLSLANVSICPLETGTLTVSGAATYTWSDNTNNNTLSDNPLTSTPYTVSGSSLGCTSVATASIILKPLPVPFISSNSPRCENTNLQLTAFGGLNYSWSGPLNYVSAAQNTVINSVGLTHAGVYDLTVTAVNGCTATANTTVIVNPTPTLSAAGSTVCTIQTASLTASSLPGSSYQWSGPLSFNSIQQNPTINSPSVSASGSYTVKVTSPQNCTASAVANVSVVPPPSLTAQLSSHSLCSQAFNGSPNTITLTAGGANTYSLVTVPDMSISNPSGPVSNLTAIPPNTGIASATLSGSNGVCTVTTGLTFSIIPNPTVSVSNYTPEICAGQSFTYTNAGANSYTWSNTTPNFTTYNNGGVAVAHPSINSVFSVYGGSLGCNSASKTSTITVYPVPTVSIAPGNTSVCIGSSTVLTAGGSATSFTWQPFTGLNQQTGSQVIASPTLNQTYTVTGSANNCTNTAVVTLTVLALPTPVAKASGSAVCVNQAITLMGEGGERYHWAGPNRLEYDGKTVQFKAYEWNSAEYTLTVTDKNGCVNATVVPVTVNPLPGGSLKGDRMQDCVPFCSEFWFDPSVTGSSVSTSWQVGYKTYPGEFFSHCFTEPGQQIIKGHFTDNRTGCINTQTFAVNGLPAPVADFRWSPEKPVEGLEDVLFFEASQGEGLVSFSWAFADNKNTQSENQNTSYFFSQPGLYPVALIVKNSHGCPDTIVKLVEVAPDFAFYVPDAFTPNDDGRNDVFVPVARGVKLYDFKIFNRWGELIFASTDLEQGWDGSFHSLACEQDVYVWKVVLTTVHGNTKTYAGHVTLVR